MKILLTAITLLLSIFSFSQGLDTQDRDDAGAFGTGIKSGFYQTLNPLNFPVGATSWWHLLDIRHSNGGNNYAMQFSGSFFDQKLYFRKTNNSASESWNEIYHSGNLNNSSSDFTTRKIFVNDDLILKNHGNFAGAGNRIQFTSFGDSQFGPYIKSNLYFASEADSKIALMFGSYWEGAKNELTLKNGSVGIGTQDPQATLDVNGKSSFRDNVAVHAKLEATEVKVTTTPTADFVFAENYKLPTLEEVELHIKASKHLPEVASAKEMQKNGVNVGEFQIKLLQKIEELTLYQIDLNKRLKSLEQENKFLKKKNK